MSQTPITLPTFCYPKKDPENPCPCQDRPVELTHKTCVIFWQKSVGDSLRAGEVLAEAEADKKTVELPSPVSGRLVQRCVEDGDSITFEQVLGYIEGET
ncbi:lipoyl domain-containing protein [Ruminococcaceae bacterium OttesenSCG-928-I18]|nr:lipoyl domain-containing protein [Ruminococcaceae bacterium OttesenSCG-928-I18]